MPNKINLKKITNTINTLFSKPKFFEKLCKLSNNDINIVINNISKIINYYLVTQDTIISYSILELLSKSNEIKETNQNILFHPSNSFYINQYRIGGINPYIHISPINSPKLDILDQNVSLFPHNEIDSYSSIYQSINQAIIESFSCPEQLFKSVLKQPKGKELPFVVGTTETNYYQSILDIRLRNIKEEEQKTNSKIGKKAISQIIGKDSMLVLFPRKTPRYEILEKDIKDNITGVYIPPTELSFIKIPSKYKLLSICATNKQLRNGELLDINTGLDYQLPSPSDDFDYWPQYSRYEAISVTEDFIYTNSEFTGDISYDIDLIYGQLDSNKSREIAFSDPAKNIASIKRRDDIIVRKIGDKYNIRNGRHRILYLKHFYVSNYEEYKRDNKLHMLKKYITIPMNVESAIQDKLANEYLLKIFQLFPNVYIFKIDINNDDPSIILTIDKKSYALKNVSEIIKFYNYIKDNQFENEFYLIENDPTNNQNYSRLFDHLVLTLKEKIFDMNLLEIIEYILKEGIIIDNTKYNILKLNIHQIYSSYSDLQRNVQLNRLFNLKKDLISITANKYKIRSISNYIMSIIQNNPELIELSWDDFHKVLLTYEDLSSYDKEFLKEAADLGGYQKIKLEYLLKEMDDTNTKSTKSMIK